MEGDVDLRLLRHYVAVAEELHFGRAAARVHITQPSLSVQIRKLEHLVGVELLTRTSRHVELTPAGRVFLEESRRLLNGAERMFELTRDVAGGARGSLVVGFLANAAGELTPRILSAFASAHPQVQVAMRQHDFTDPYLGLAEGAVDVAFLRPPVLVHEWLAMETLFVEPCVLVVSSDSRFAAHDEVSIAMVADEPFVARRAPDVWRDFWLATDRRHGHPVRIGAEVATVEECFEAILGGRGVAFTPASTQRYYARPGLAFVPVRDPPTSSVTVAWRRDAESRMVADFVSAARAVAAVGGVPGAIADPVAPEPVPVAG